VISVGRVARREKGENGGGIEMTPGQIAQQNIIKMIDDT
jgi:hypothetical protein